MSHGPLALELLASARVIAGDLPGFTALALDWQDSPRAAEEKVADALACFDGAEGILILTDMYGSTPSNIALGFCGEDRVEMIAGVNLPMVVRLASLNTDGMTVGAIAAWLQEKGRASVCCRKRRCAGASEGGDD